MLFKEFRKKIKKPNWITGIFVTVSDDKYGRSYQDLLSYDISYKDLNPKLRKLLDDATVKNWHKSGPYNSAYSYSVELDFTVTSIKYSSVSNIELPNGLKLRSKYDRV